jgi:hypothetical protein
MEGLMLLPIPPSLFGFPREFLLLPGFFCFFMANKAQKRHGNQFSNTKQHELNRDWGRIFNREFIQHLNLGAGQARTEEKPRITRIGTNNLQ